MKKPFEVKKLSTVKAAPPFHPELHVFEVLFVKGDIQWGCKLQGPDEPTQAIIDDLFNKKVDIFWIEAEAVVEEKEKIPEKALTKSEECSKIDSVDGQVSEEKKAQETSEESEKKI